MAVRAKKPDDLREACVREALAIIETSGVESLSLREVARRLGVSHQAPYKHFPSRDHILAEIVARAFDAFAAELDGRPRSDDPYEDLAEMGRAYFKYARSHPLQYRLMFGTPLPDPAEHKAMMLKARHAFALLRDCIVSLPPPTDALDTEDAADLDALFVWSSVHGLASILASHAMETLDMPDRLLQAAAAQTLQRIGMALDAERRGPAKQG